MILPPDTEAGLGACIRHSLSEIAASAVVESSSHKIAKWAFACIFSSCVESSNDSGFQLRAKTVQKPMTGTYEKHDEINSTPEFNGKKAIMISCLSSNQLGLTAALRCELLSNLSSHTARTVLKAMSELKKRINTMIRNC